MAWCFDGHSLDIDRRELRRGDEMVALQPQVFDLLVYLMQNRERVVSRDDLLVAVWGGRIVSELTLAARINAARKAVGDSGAAQRLIQTMPRKGFRFIGEVREEQASTPTSPRAPHLSMVVLPFLNLSNDPQQEYFADGITDDLTTDLSRLADMLVISRNTAFTYRNKSIDTKQIGRELCVRYVLEGSVRRSGGRVRVNVQLIDAQTDAHLWAERFDGDASDLLVVQDEITSRIANLLGVELIAAEAARPTDHPDALDYILQGRAVLLKPRTPDTHREATQLFERVLALDPQSVEAQYRLAAVLVDSVATGMTDAASAAPSIARAEELVDRALAVSPRSADAHIIKGHVLRAQKRWEEAILEYEAALELNHNSVYALNSLAWCKLYTGSIDDAIPLVEKAIRLSPRDPVIGSFYNMIGTLHLVHSHTDEAIVWFEKACKASPGVPIVRSRLAATYALRGETERAASELAEARRLSGGGPFSSIAHLKAYPNVWSGARRSAHCMKPPISPASAKPECRRSKRPRIVGGAPVIKRH